MKKILFPLAFCISVIFMSSTAKHPSAVTPFNDQSFFTIDDYAWSDCSGESIHITGQIHIDVHGVINNNRINFAVHDNYQGLTGVGETSGKLYAASGSYSDVYNGNFTGSFTESTNSSVRFNVAGGGNNLVFTIHANTTVNANGAVTVSRYRDSFHCQ
jgi:hypothetical protein